MPSLIARSAQDCELSALALTEIELTLARHEAYVRNSREGEKAALLSRHLSGLDLSNRALAGADLSGSNLSRTSLKFTNLARANLYCCEMSHVDGRYANFLGADMRGVSLSGSNLSHACLDKADFRAGRLLKTDPGGKDLIVDRAGVANGVDFSYCSLNGTSFEGADLAGANFTGAVLVGTRFKGARLAGAVLKGAILTDVDLNEITLPREALQDCVLPPSESALEAKNSILFRLKSHHVWIESDGRRGTSAELDGMDLRPLAATIGKFKLTALSARRAIAAGVDFSCTELQGANFEGADLRGASFEGADLRGARFKGALLHHAKFLGADMRPLELKNGSIMPCDLSETQFTSEQRAEAVFA